MSTVSDSVRDLIAELAAIEDARRELSAPQGAAGNDPVSFDPLLMDLARRERLIIAALHGDSHGRIPTPRGSA